MRKIDYILISYKQTIQKIWNQVYDKFVKLKKLCLYLPLAYLFLIFGYLGLFVILLIGFIAYLIIFFQDIRFTPHYMQTVIAHENMSIEQANEYLNSQQQEYKKSLSYGNFSPQERNSINTTFELLLNEYKLPEPIDKKHQELIISISDVKNVSLEGNKGILELNSNVDSLSSSVADQSYTIASGFSDIKQSIKDNTVTTEKVLGSVNSVSEQNNIIQSELSIANQSINKVQYAANLITDKINELSMQQSDSFINTQEQLGNINSNVESVKSTIEPVALYIEHKQQQETQLEKEREVLRLQQEERVKQNKRRENLKNPKHFESSLTDKQLELLLECCNEIEVFKHTVTKKELIDIFLCIHKQPLQTTNARLLSILLTNLKNAGFIHSEWQSIAARHICFKSKLGNEMKTNNDFSTAAAAAVTVATAKENIIFQYIKKMKLIENN